MKILLISNDENKKKRIAEKLVFLRNTDKLLSSTFGDLKQNIDAYNPDIILICDELTKDELSFYIDDIVKNSNICVILVTKTNNPELILTCIDSGASDFIMENSDDFEYVVRIVKHIKYHSVKCNLYSNLKLLEDLNVVDNASGFYESVYAKNVIDNSIDIDFNKSSIFMILSPDKASTKNLTYNNINHAIKNSVRCDDVICLGKGTNYYILLKNTDLNGAITVYNKIQKNLDFKIHAGMSETEGKMFDEFEKQALSALSNASATGVDYILYNNDINSKSLDNWLDDAPKKSYKLYRKVFNKKLESVIVPLFYKLQQIYEPKLVRTKIIQNVNEDSCSLVLKNEVSTSELKIIYPGFAKISIFINHEGLDTPENRKIEMLLSDVTEKHLTSVIEAFIKEYKSQQINH